MTASMSLLLLVDSTCCSSFTTSLSAPARRWPQSHSNTMGSGHGSGGLVKLALTAACLCKIAMLLLIIQL